jgi:lipopolysaccharide transport system ATP-binding protein
VKYYSSGMYMRLAFSVAAHLETEILLVDEVLAVGDVAFQQKCLGKMGDVAKQGRTVLLVSHHLAAVQRLCSRSLLLSEGILIAEGATPSVMTRYLSLMQNGSNRPIRTRIDRDGDGSLRFVDFYVETETRGVTSTLYSGEGINLVIRYESVRSQALTNVSVSIPFFNSTGQHMFMCWTRMTGQDFGRVARKGEFRAHINKMPLSPGRYTVNVWCEVNGVLSDWVREAAVIHVTAGDFFGSGFLPPASHGGLMVDHFWEHEVLSSDGHD